MQLIIGTIMLLLSSSAEEMMDDVSSLFYVLELCSFCRRARQPGKHLYTLSFAFTALVFFSATQGERDV